MFWVVCTPRADYRVVQSRGVTGLVSDEARHRTREVWFFARIALLAQAPDVVSEAFKLARRLGFSTNLPIHQVTNELVRFLENALWLGTLAFEERALPSLGPPPVASILRDVELAPAPRPAAPLDAIPTAFAVQWVDEIGVPIAGLDVVFSVSGQKKTKTTGSDGIARFTDVGGSNFAFTEATTLDTVREAVRPRWDTVRKGDFVTEADAVVVQLRDATEGIQLEADETRVISVQPHVARTRLLGGGFFDISKSFILPNGLDGIRAIVGNYGQEPGAKLLIVGHTDTAGRPDYNDILSLERAEALKDYLTDNTEGWLKWYGQVPLEKRWGAKEDGLMIGSLPDASTRSPNEPSIRWFQRTRGLTVDGVAGPETRGQLIPEYMALDGTSLPAGIEPIVHGCGENFPQDPTPDGVSDPDNRRVEVFFFDGKLGIQPPPPESNSAPDSPEYPEWVRRSKRTEDHFGVEGQQNAILRLMDSTRTPIPFASYEATVGSRSVTGNADSNGFVFLDSIETVTKCTIVWQDSSHVAANGTPTNAAGFDYQLDVFLATAHEDTLTSVRHRLHNIGYHINAPLDQCVRFFQEDYGLPLNGDPTDAATVAKLQVVHATMELRPRQPPQPQIPDTFDGGA